jgi:malonyl-CoA decarboxylase
MPRFIRAFLQNLRKVRDKDIGAICRQLISQLGEASQTALAQELIAGYESLNDAQRLEFFQMLCREFGPSEALISKAAANYHRSPTFANYQALAAAMVSPLQKLFQRMNTAPRGTETLVSMRGRVVRLLGDHPELMPLDSELRYLFGLWFNRGFLRLERIGWHTSALVLEKLIRYESVHEINGWSDLRRRLAPDRRCFAFFHPALADEPIIFVEIALTQGLVGELDPLLDVNAPVLEPEQADTTMFYSISNCLDGLRGVSFGSFLIKQVVVELGAEFPGIKLFGTLSPLTRFARALRDQHNQEGFTRPRLSRLLADFEERLLTESGKGDRVEALFSLLQDPLHHRDALARPLHRLALAYLTQLRVNGRVLDPVANFHLSNGARLERINPFSNLRPYGLTQSFGLTANYRYVPDELEENHEHFVTEGQFRVSSRLLPEQRIVAALWMEGETGKKSPHGSQRS